MEKEEQAQVNTEHGRLYISLCSGWAVLLTDGAVYQIFETVEDGEEDEDEDEEDDEEEEEVVLLDDWDDDEL